jgi:hypothetical protein
MVDAAATAGLERTESAVKAFGKLVRDAESFVDAVAVGGVESKTITEYAQGAMRAHFHGVEWTPRLKNDSAMALPWGKAGKGATAATPNGGKVTSTDRAELDKTAVKLLAQARALGLTGLAADLLDVLLEGLDGFKEPKAAPV